MSIPVERQESMTPLEFSEQQICSFLFPTVKPVEIWEPCISYYSLIISLSNSWTKLKNYTIVVLKEHNIALTYEVGFLYMEQTIREAPDQFNNLERNRMNAQENGKLVIEKHYIQPLQSFLKPKNC